MGEKPLESKTAARRQHHQRPSQNFRNDRGQLRMPQSSQRPCLARAVQAEEPFTWCEASGHQVRGRRVKIRIADAQWCLSDRMGRSTYQPGKRQHEASKPRRLHEFVRLRSHAFAKYCINGKLLLRSLILCRRLQKPNLTVLLPNVKLRSQSFPASSKDGSSASSGTSKLLAPSADSTIDGQRFFT